MTVLHENIFEKKNLSAPLFAQKKTPRVHRVSQSSFLRFVCNYLFLFCRLIPPLLVEKCRIHRTREPLAVKPGGGEKEDRTKNKKPEKERVAVPSARAEENRVPVANTSVYVTRNTSSLYIPKIFVRNSLGLRALFSVRSPLQYDGVSFSRIVQFRLTS